MNVRWNRKGRKPEGVVDGLVYEVKRAREGDFHSTVWLRGVEGEFNLSDFEVIGPIDFSTMNYPEKFLVFGVGSARCGSKSLRLLFEGQPHTAISHEAVVLPWSQQWKKMDRHIMEFTTRSARLVGDIAPWYLPYCPRLIAGWKAKVICLKRDKERTVDSFLRQPCDHCSIDPAKSERPGEELYNSLPKFSALSRREAAEKYWDHYYELADDIQSRFPDHFRIFPTECLNFEEDQRAMCEFVGIPPEDFHPVNVDPRYTQYACSLFTMGGL